MKIKNVIKSDLHYASIIKELEETVYEVVKIKYIYNQVKLK